MSKTYLNLRQNGNRSLSINQDELEPQKRELEEFLKEEKNMETKTFAKRVMFSHEIKANNGIEGYSDDIEIIQKTIESKCNQISDSKQKQRILNLYHGYKYILEHKEINENTLKELYKILSESLLEQSDLEKMGPLYRDDKVYILKSGRLDIVPDEGVPCEEIKKHMDMYFEFLNTYPAESQTDIYIKSQILHYYFVYIHPYFDVNGRTSRTLSMWYLLNNKAYPYIIFNRGISFKGSNYDKAIIDVKKYNDITFFVKYMLETVLLELEKEHIMQQVANSANEKFEAKDYQTLLYFLTLKGEKNVLDFASIYNRYNDKKSVSYIYSNIIEPLIEKGIFTVERDTSRYMFSDKPNQVLTLKKNLYSSEKIKRLQI